MGGKPRVAGLGAGLVQALRAVATFLGRHEARGTIIGGIAVIACGVPRVTRDIDVAFTAADVTIAALIDQLGAVGISPRIPDAAAFAAESQVLLMRHVDTGIDVDVSRAWLPFELEAIAACDHRTLAGVPVPVARPEDLVIFKAIAWRPQDQQDVERLLALHGDRMDLERVRRRVGELAEALEIDRLPALEALIAGVMGTDAAG